MPWAEDPSIRRLPNKWQKTVWRGLEGFLLFGKSVFGPMESRRPCSVMYTGTVTVQIACVLVALQRLPRKSSGAIHQNLPLSSAT